MYFKWTTSIHSKIYHDAVTIRTLVFIDEQKVPKQTEFDHLEEKCHHVVAYNYDNTPIACARLYLLPNNISKIQRVAVLPLVRRKNIGKKLVTVIETYAKTLSIKQLKLSAQVHAIPFYKKLGYTITSEEYIKANIAHCDMIKNV